jgi:hypothetical protein
MTENIRSAIARLSCSIFRVLVPTMACLSPCGAVFAQQQAPGGGQAQSAAKTSVAEDDLKYETLKVRKEGAVLFVEIAAPPMNLLGPELVRDPPRVSGSRASTRPGAGFGPRACTRPRRRDRNRDGNPRSARSRSWEPGPSVAIRPPPGEAFRRIAGRQIHPKSTETEATSSWSRVVTPVLLCLVTRMVLLGQTRRPNYRCRHPLFRVQRRIHPHLHVIPPDEHPSQRTRLHLPRRHRYSVRPPILRGRPDLIGRGTVSGAN